MQPERFSEIDLVYNPSIGGFLVWRASSGSLAENGRAFSIPLAFLVLPLLLHWQSNELIGSTNKSSGLTLYGNKLGAHQEDLLAVHQRALLMRQLSLDSILMAQACQMLAIDSANASLLPLDAPAPTPLSELVRKLGMNAEKLGCWFARHDLPQIAATLRVEL
jgi:hypothetical protein